MNPKSPFEDRLDDWMEDGPTRAPDQLLDTVFAAVPSIPQRRGAWRVPWRVSPMLGFARAVAGIAIAIALGSAALLFLVFRPSGGDVGSQASSSPLVIAAATPSASPSASPTASPSLVPTPAPTPKPTAVPTPGPCDPATVAARITLWEGAAGSRIANVTMTNTGSGPCVVHAMARPQLVDGRGNVLIDSGAPGASSALTIAPGGTLKTLVSASNYCGPAPRAPVTVAFILSDGGRIVATPFSPSDTTGVPPCNGAGQAAWVSMRPWAP
jgi:uncharacterized protein DUF4232